MICSENKENTLYKCRSGNDAILKQHNNGDTNYIFMFGNNLIGIVYFIMF